MWTVFLRMGAGSPSRAVPPLNNLRPAKIDNEYQGARHKEAYREIRLRTIHKNPGPGPKTEIGREDRRRRRMEYRKTRRETKEKTETTDKEIPREKISIVTWNVQRMSLSDRSRRKAKMVAKKAVEEKWEVTLLTELWAEKEGLVRL